MNLVTRPANVRVDQFFTVAEARFDRWRSLLQAVRDWDSVSKQEHRDKERYHGEVGALFAELHQWEDFFAYPGQTLLRLLNDSVGLGDAAGTVRLVQNISTALLTHSYRSNPVNGGTVDQTSISFVDKIPGHNEDSAPHRPYFEVLVVSPARQEVWSELSQELRKLRRSHDKFIYETVFVGSFEDAVLGVILNGGIEAVVIYEGLPFASLHNNPVLREFLTTHLAAQNVDTKSTQLGLALAESIKQLRPELDIYFLSDRQSEKIAGQNSASSIR